MYIIDSKNMLKEPINVINSIEYLFESMIYVYTFGRNTIDPVEFFLSV